MKSMIVADGAARLIRGKKFDGRLQGLRDSIRARHESELADAGFFARLVLRWRMAAELRRERRKIEPSAYSLYSNKMAAQASHLERAV